MMSKTHISVGIAAALAAAPATPEGLVYALMGGALGSVVCDIDRNAEQPSRDAKQGWGVAGTIFFAAFMHESMAYWQNFRLSYLLGDPKTLVCLLFLAAILLFAANGAHRGFSHSLRMFLSTSFFLFILSRKTCLFYGIAFLTHLVLDVMNKRPLKLLFPLSKGFCLRWCYCDGLVNRILMWAGTAAAAGLLIAKFGVNNLNLFR